MTNVIVSRHAGALEWLKKHHPSLVADGARVITGNATPVDVQGKIIFGMLPMRLAALAAGYWEIDLDIPFALRGMEVTLAQMEALGAKLTHYQVLVISPTVEERARKVPHPTGTEIFLATSMYYGSHPEYGEGDEEHVLAVPVGRTGEVKLEHGHNHERVSVPVGTFEFDAESNSWIPLKSYEE